MKHRHPIAMHFAVSILGLVMFAGSSWMVLSDQWNHHALRHGIGGWMCAKLNPVLGFMGDSGSTSSVDVRFVVEANSGFEVAQWITPEDRRAGLMACQREGKKSFEAIISEECQHRGAWAVTRRPYKTTIDLNEAFGPNENDWNYYPRLETEELQAIRRIALESETSPYFWVLKREIPRLIESGESSGTRTIWSGFAINAAALIGLGMWVIPIPVIACDLRRLRRVRQCKCWKCAYDLRGLAPGTSVCPECGSAVIIREAGGTSRA